jgi:hypothetical protein
MRFAKPVRFVVFAQFLQICADFRKRTSNAPATEAFLSFLHDAVHPFLAIRRQPTRVFEEISQTHKIASARSAGAAHSRAPIARKPRASQSPRLKRSLLLTRTNC